MTDKPMSAIFASSLTSDAAIAWHMGRLVAELHPGKSVLDGVQAPFDVIEFARARKCEATLAVDAHAELSTSWARSYGLHSAPENALYDVSWDGHQLRVVVASWRAGFKAERPACSERRQQPTTEHLGGFLLVAAVGSFSLTVDKARRTTNRTSVAAWEVVGATGFEPATSSSQMGLARSLIGAVLR
jgi:hypothetical protein